MTWFDAIILELEGTHEYINRSSEKQKKASVAHRKIMFLKFGLGQKSE